METTISALNPSTPGMFYAFLFFVFIFPLEAAATIMLIIITLPLCGVFPSVSLKQSAIKPSLSEGGRIYVLRAMHTQARQALMSALQC